MREPFVGLCWGPLGGCALGAGGQNPGPGPRPAGPPLSASQAVSTDATVRFVAVEGGCRGVQTGPGGFEPVKLPAAVRTDGPPVGVGVRGAPPRGGRCMSGPVGVSRPNC